MGLFSIISELFDVTKAASKIIGDKANDQEFKDSKRALSSLMGRTKSISSMAQRYILEYPVMISENVSEYDKAIKIAKYVEAECAKFVVLSSSLTPIINAEKGDAIKDHIDTLSLGYSGENLSITIDDEIPFSLENDMNIVLDNLNSLPPYESIKPRSFLSTEDRFVDLDDVKDDPTVKGSPEGDGVTKIKKERYGETALTTQTINNLSKLNKEPPTIITLKVRIKTANDVSDIHEIPLAIKSRLHYLSDEEMVSFLEDVLSSMSTVTTLVKLTTGEISFFKDFLLNLSSIEKDLKSEKRLGRYPFFRQLLDRKNRHGLRQVGKLIPFVKDFIAKGELMPTCTLIITKSELEAATKLKFSYLVNNKRHIEKLINKLMLLGLGVYDEINDVVFFYFSGVNDPDIVPISKMGGKDSNDSTKIMADLVKIAMRR